MKTRFIFGLLTVALLVLFLANSGCGVARANCRLGGQTCDSLLGKDVSEQVDQLQADVRLIKLELDSLSTQLNYMIADINADTAQLLTLQNAVLVLQSTVTANDSATTAAINGINSEISQIVSRINYQDTRIADMLTDIVELQQQDTVTEYIYPCSNRPNYFDEVLVRTNSGKLLAYFENGANRYLSLLKPGNYQTTDSAPRCNFTVNASLQIVNAYR